MSENAPVRFGSLIALRHESNGRRRLNVTSIRPTTLPRDSMQFVVNLALDPVGDVEWLVEAEHGKQTPVGQIVTTGTIVRLVHRSGRKLHAHHPNYNPEVTTIQVPQGDRGDNWIVGLPAEGAQWKVNEPFALLHEQMRTFLREDSFEPGKLVKGPNDNNAKWVVTKSLTPQEFALEQIALARQTGAKLLDLSFSGLTSLPPEIGQLTQLEMLGLKGNQLESLPPEIRACPLKVLDVIGNDKLGPSMFMTNRPAVEIINYYFASRAGKP